MLDAVFVMPFLLRKSCSLQHCSLSPLLPHPPRDLHMASQKPTAKLDAL